VTCIVGLVDGNNVIMGADSAGVDGSLALSIRRDPKLVWRAPYLIGFTTSFRMGQLLAHAFKPPEPCIGESVMRFMVVDFVDAVRACLKDGGFASKTNEQESAGTFLVGFLGRVFWIENDYQVAEPDCGYAACGSGRDVALGSLHATRCIGMPAEERVKKALEAAAAHNAAVHRPFLIETTGGAE
jgi:ATP-dependent protease HslVU (ClpYQ) peptidase subunit